MSDFNTWTNVVVQNGMSHTADITLTHQYSNDQPTQQETWNAVASGATTSPLKCGYNTGFVRYGEDYWHVEANANGQHYSSMPMEATLHTGDANKQISMVVNDSGITLVPNSGGSTHVAWAIG